MINNRQPGRRRGRSGQRPQGGGNSNNQGNGNRIDNRARGNAAQLLEKYKNLARDAQMQGDRVNTEYYLQFADHYFRVLAETRSRFEENQGNRPQRQNADDGEDFEYENEGDRVDGPATQEEREDRGNRNGQYNGHSNGNYRADEGDEFDPRDQDRSQQQSQPPRRNPQPQRDDDRGQPRRQAEPRGEDRQPRRPIEPRNEEREQPRRQAEPRNEDREQPRRQPEPRAEAEQPRRNAVRRPRRDAAEDVAEPQGFDATILPPALTVEAAPEAEAEAPKPRRGRPRRNPEAPAA